MGFFAKPLKSCKKDAPPPALPWNSQAFGLELLVFWGFAVVKDYLGDVFYGFY